MRLRWRYALELPLELPLEDALEDAMRLSNAFGLFEGIVKDYRVCVGGCYALEICVWTFVIVRSIHHNVLSNRRFVHRTILPHCIQRFCQFLLDFPCQI